jgi:2-(3-amino-3-carboxypropyl)histidine synthase
LIFATRIAEVLRRFTGVDTILMGDITYGACCVDDFTASMLGAELLVHYGHSCLVPTSVANHIETIYVFVTIKFDVEETVQSIQGLLKEKSVKESESKSKHVKISCCQNEEGEGCRSDSQPINLSLVSTIQFAASLPTIKEALETKEVEVSSGYKIKATIPRSKPLSGGEILGCTAPKVTDDLIIYIGDGRFHLEAMMMANPSIEAYR